jgi:AcrR family transcriptional regulator
MRLAGHLNIGTREFRDEAARVAQGVFVARGYAAATLEEIAAKVKTSRPALLHHFASKAHLAAAARAAASQRLAAAITPSEEAPRAGIERLAGGLLRFAAKESDTAAYLFLSEGLEFPSDATRELRALERDFQAGVERWFKPHIRRGDLARLHPSSYEALVLGPSRDYARRWLAHRNRRELRVVGEVLVAAAWNAVRGR